jgi:hypothetical protein
MTVLDMIAQLKSYPDCMDVRVLDQYGSQTKLTEIDAIIDSYEIDEEINCVIITLKND